MPGRVGIRMANRDKAKQKHGRSMLTEEQKRKLLGKSDKDASGTKQKRKERQQTEDASESNEFAVLAPHKQKSKISGKSQLEDRQIEEETSGRLAKQPALKRQINVPKVDESIYRRKGLAEMQEDSEEGQSFEIDDSMCDMLATKKSMT